MEHQQPGEAGVPAGRSVEPPRTSFDLDLHDPKAGETYGSISKLHYGDLRYGDALRAFNNYRDLGRGGPVEVPPEDLPPDWSPGMMPPDAPDAGPDMLPPPAPMPEPSGE